MIDKPHLDLKRMAWACLCFLLFAGGAEAKLLEVAESLVSHPVQWEDFGSARQFTRSDDKLVFHADGKVSNTHVDFIAHLKGGRPYIYGGQLANLGQNLSPTIRIASLKWLRISSISNPQAGSTQLLKAVFTVENDMDVRVQLFGYRLDHDRSGMPTGKAEFGSVFLRPADDSDMQDAFRAKVSINTTHPLAQTSKLFVGTNSLYWIDTPKVMQREDYIAQLKTMGVSLLRFPAGEAADDYDWRTAKGNMPFTPNPTTRQRDVAINQPTEFDQYMTWARKIGAQPILVVNLESCISNNDIEQGIELACQWVRYSNITQGYNVRYWEIGNESYLLGGCLPLTSEEYARAFARFAKAMKQVDPTIKVGANGPSGAWAVGGMDSFDEQTAAEFRGRISELRKNPQLRKSYFGKRVEQPDVNKAWWPTVCKIAGDQLDFVAVHHYVNRDQRASFPILGTMPLRMQNVFSSLGQYLQQTLHRDIPLALTEWNVSHNVSGLSPFEAALTNVEMAFNAINAGVQMGCFWPMRWPEGEYDKLAMFEMDCQPRPVFWALKEVFDRLGDHVLACDVTGSDELYVAATADTTEGKVYCFIINRCGVPQSMQVTLPILGSGSVLAQTLTQQQVHPALPLSVQQDADAVKLQLAPRSMTVVTFENVTFQLTDSTGVDR